MYCVKLYTNTGWSDLSSHSIVSLVNIVKNHIPGQHRTFIKISVLFQVFKNTKNFTEPLIYDCETIVVCIPLKRMYSKYRLESSVYILSRSKLYSKLSFTKPKCLPRTVEECVNGINFLPPDNKRDVGTLRWCRV